jgi:hypothetical protein
MAELGPRLETLHVKPNGRVPNSRFPVVRETFEAWGRNFSITPGKSAGQLVESGHADPHARHP